MNRIINTIILLFLVLSVQAQTGAGSVSGIEVNKLGSWNPQWDTVGFSSTLITERQPHSSPFEEKLKEYKMEGSKRKWANKDNISHTLNPDDVQHKTTIASNPSVTEGFSTASTQGTPSDNSIGVNTQGIVVVAVNSLIRYYTTSGASRSGTISLSSFFANPSNGSLLTNNTCDPKVLFDPRSKRFIIMAQTCDANSSSSQVLVAFSKTEDPTNGWNYYTFTGNPQKVAGDNWFDYPKIGINDHDLFVTGNLFTNTFSYKQSVVYQLDKTIGYAGGVYSTGDAVLHYNISGSPFTLVPATVGRDLSMGNKMYLVSTLSGWTNTANVLRFYELDGPVQSSPSLTRTDLYVSQYTQPEDAIQQGSNTFLDIGDFRGMDAIYVNGTIHFVAHVLGTNDYTEIMYDRIYYSNGMWNVAEYTIGASGVDLAYPSIASMGYTDDDQSVGIFMDFASPNHYPSLAGIYINNEAEASDIIILKEGTSHVSIFPSGGTTRWGDYTGACRDFSASTPTVWGYGMYGSGSSSSWKNYVSNMVTNQSVDDVELTSKDNETIEIYPNPIYDVWNMKFETEHRGIFSANVYSLDGRLIKNLYATELNSGKHSFAFNKGALNPGSYIVTLSFNGKDISSEKIMVKDK